MDWDVKTWQVWEKKLRYWGLHDFIASFLESAGYLTILAAQVIYVGQPLLNQVFPENQIESLANLLEDQNQKKAFAALLREEAFQ